MPNIVLTRIDNRLVHGQVATQWCGAIGANLILVANDEVAGNSLRQGLMNMAALLMQLCAIGPSKRRSTPSTRQVQSS